MYRGIGQFHRNRKQAWCLDIGEYPEHDDTDIDYDHVVKEYR
jgi:hypothetical protein